jgi:hypothetical protein
VCQGGEEVAHVSQHERIYAGVYSIHFDRREGQWVLFDRRTATIVIGADGMPKTFLTEHDARDWAVANSRVVTS